jgi:nitrite reductase (NADH) large subunit
MSGTRETRSVCGFCGVGCGVIVLSEGARVVGVRGDPDHPANRGALCTKGLALAETVHIADRLRHPQQRARKGASLERIGWDAALDRLAGALRHTLATRGPDAIGLYLSGQLTSEDYYALNKLARGVLGTPHLDSNSRLCMSSAVAGYQRAFGVDGPPCCYQDLELADLVLVVGANPAWCHPVLFQRVLAARGRSGARPRLVVIDPRRTASAEVADIHVPLRPGSDAVFLTGLLAELARRGRLDDRYVADHTENFEATLAVLPDFAPERVEAECGVPRALFERVADAWAEASAALTLWAMGVNQSAHGTDTVNAITNLHLATGHMGRPGAGPFSLTGQPNAMGGREVGAMATLLAAHRDLASAQDRRELETVWGCGSIPAGPGHTAVELFEHAAAGGLDVLWIAGSNPAITLPDLNAALRGLERTPLVVVQDAVGTTATARFADLLLPAASWGEKAGTMTNSERGVARLRAAVPPPGEALPDWRIAARVAERLGHARAFAWRDAEEVFAEHVATTAGRDCDMRGMTAARLEKGPLQWPCPGAAHPGSPRLYTDGRFATPSGRARFVVPGRFRPAEDVCEGAPLALTTVRLRDQWHTMTKTGAVARLCAHTPEPELEIAPADASRFGVLDGDALRVASARGAFEMRARVSDTVPEGVVSAPMHWGVSAGSDARVNLAAHAELDPHSKQPELKHAAVRVERLECSAPAAHQPAARGLCACRDVALRAVEAAVAAGAQSLADVERSTSAGGGCGTCRPEIAGLLRRAPAAPPRRTLVVVGHGMVGHRLVEAVLERGGASRWRIVVVGEEPRPAYDRVHLSDLFAGRSADDLALARADDCRARGVELRVGARAARIDRAQRAVWLEDGSRIDYDALVLATGSRPFVPPVPGTEKAGVFVYRTVEDVEAIRKAAAGASRGIVIGGGLLGLEAAKALRDLGLDTHVVEAAPRLMPRQLDAAGSDALVRRIEALGVTVHLARPPSRVLGGDAAAGLRFADGSELAADLVVISAGIRPRDELASEAGLASSERGGVAVDDLLRTSDPSIFAIGEVAAHRGTVYGLVAPGYAMADVLAANLCAARDAAPVRFAGADVSTRLKLLGVDVGCLGDPFAGGASPRDLVLHDRRRDVYLRLVLSADGQRLVGGVLVGDVSQFARLQALLRDGGPVPEEPLELLFGAGASTDAEVADTTRICSCNGVSASALRAAIRAGGCDTVAALKQATKAGTGCGGCLPEVATLLAAELAAAERAATGHLCEHFAFTRQELFQIVQVTGARSFETLLASHGQGSGCEICKPAVASILASLWNEPILDHPTIQDTNDRFLANIQRGGTYSVIPRIPGGEITPEKLIALGRVAARYGLYCKITGGQRIDLLGARVDQLPSIWKELVEAGFESGHAYGKALRTVKSCVGTTWCRYGVQDSTGLAIRLEERYRGIRAPHKIKSAVSGCIRECAEAQGKDFGVIASSRGWSLYVCGNGGAKPRHAELLAADLDEATLVRTIDRFLMFYIRTADRLTRTARWLESLPGGIEYLKKVVLDDHLGICAELERQLQHLVDTYECEWKRVVESPELQARFRHFANSSEPDDSLRFVSERGQRRPADWEPATPSAPDPEDPADGREWVPLASADEVPRDGGVAVRYGDVQLALFHLASRGTWYATQNRCPHMRDMVLARGIVGDQAGRPKVACPLHKKTFDLVTGEGLSDPEYRIAAFPARVEDGKVYVLLPPAERLAEWLAETRCTRAEDARCSGR